MNKKLTEAFTKPLSQYQASPEELNKILQQETYTLADVVPQDEAYLLVYSHPAPSGLPPGRILQVIARTDARITFTVEANLPEPQLYTHPFQ